MQQPPDPHHPPAGPPPFPGPPGGSPAVPIGWAPQPNPQHAIPTNSATPPPVGGAAPSRSGRAGVLSALLVALFTCFVANEWVLRFVTERLRRRELQPLITPLFFAHWSALPASDAGRAGRDVLTRGFWTDANGGRIFQTLGFGDDGLLHWLFNFVRLGMVVAAVAVAVAVALSRHRGGFAARTVSAWGAIAIAAGVSGALSSVTFELVNGEDAVPLAAALLGGGGFGGLWALTFGWLFAIPAALIARPR
ncbi:MAG: hypothetical protein IT196_18150 [Acidimicrobiales bacterium]|nr:hypothetical protein [Acidimicrobiales bacterium]